MSPIYLGVDVGGMGNTWMTALSMGGDGLTVVCGPHTASLEAIVRYCDSSDVVAVAIDAQLTAALSEENGFRTSDMELQDMLSQRGGSPNWVVSANGLMAVPVRGRLLAEHLAPTVGTLLETHPRASLLFGLGHEENQEEIRTAIREYKRRRNDNQRQTEIRSEYTRKLWRFWSKSLFHPDFRSLSVCDDGALDALVCATVAYCFHHAPKKLHKLRHEALGKAGRGSFYVMAPDALAETG
jgi:predicted nuclease with RNAse H fold